MDKHYIAGHEALSRLMAGNSNFCDGQFAVHPTKQDILALKDRRHPFAAIMACADSRVPPELVLGCSLGELFVVRTAGNVISDFELGSIEYAVDSLGVPLVMVLGHSDCGAVASALDPESAAGALRKILEELAPSVERAKMETDDPEQIARLAEDYNILHAVEKLKAAAKLKTETLIVGAKYDICNGTVSVLTK